jgi:gliding motility-associated-like protein
VNDTVNLSIVNPNAELQYNWSPSNFIISGQTTSSVNVRVPETTVFYVQSIRADGCEALDSVLVSVSELSLLAAQATATPNLVVQGQTVQLSAQPSGYSYLWNPSTTLNNPTLQNPTATPMETTTYAVTITDGECLTKASVRVRVEDFICGTPSIYVPSAFTPNADGKNELLKVRGNNITRIYFALYDRWGEKVFETTSLDHGWDGKFRGKECDPAVYVYYLEIDCAGGASFIDKGNVTLIR